MKTYEEHVVTKKYGEKKEKVVKAKLLINYDMRNYNITVYGKIKRLTSPEEKKALKKVFKKARKLAETNLKPML